MKMLFTYFSAYDNTSKRVSTVWQTMSGRPVSHHCNLIRKISIAEGHCVKKYHKAISRISLTKIVYICHY